MLDLNYVRENLIEVQRALENRGASDEMLRQLQQFSSYDAERRQIIAESDNLNAQRNQMSLQIGSLMKEGKTEEALRLRTVVADLKEAIAKKAELRELREMTMRQLLSTLPNIPHRTDPVGHN